MSYTKRVFLVGSCYTVRKFQGWPGMLLSDEKKAIEKFYKEKHEVFLSLASELDGITIQQIKPNKTGNKMDVITKINGKKLVFHICTREYDPSSVTHDRTKSGIIEEIVGQYIGRFFIITLIHRSIEKEINDPTKYLSYTTIELYLIKRLLTLVKPDIFEPIVDSVQHFLASGEIESQRDAHQGKRSLDGVRAAASHAFRHGVDIEQIVAAVREELVRNVIEV